MSTPPRYRNRTEGGEALAGRLRDAALTGPLVVLALPRGGLPTAIVVARELAAPLDILTVRKIGLPGDSECAIGAVAPGVVFRDEATMPFLGITEEAFSGLADHARAELERREKLYRQHLPELDLAGVTAIIVDDGLATGSTMLAAVKAVRARGARRIVVAVPVASREAVARLRAAAISVVAPLVPEYLRSVGEWYDEFDQVTDAETITLLETASRQRRPASIQEPSLRSTP